MILVKLQGGLGNQMFQYATSRSLIKQPDKVQFDHTFLEQNNADKEHFTARKFELDIFKNIKANKTPKWKVNFFMSQSFSFRLLRLILNRRLLFIRQIENELITLPIHSKNGNLYLDGYFQSEKYFKPIRQQLLNEFEFPEFDPYNEDLKQQIIKSRNSVSIHVRRGDYIKSERILNVHGVLNYSYYQKAIDILNAVFTGLDFFIFSDDMKWAKETFKEYNTQFFDHNKGNESWKDMALMSYCKHHIIANSSFSWWGAWLSKNTGYTFAPSRWFNPLTVNFNIRDFIPDNWTILDVE
jgi:hypothetical protein